MKASRRTKIDATQQRFEEEDGYNDDDLYDDDDFDDEDEDEEDDDDDDLTVPGDIQRRCTDVGCAIFFLILQGIVAVVFIGFVWPNGNVGRLFGCGPHGCQGHLRKCGRQNFGNGTELQELLLFCSNASHGHFDIEHPVCVQACPKAGDRVHECVGHYVSPYDTVPFAQMLCQPGYNERWRAETRDWGNIATWVFIIRVLARHWQLLFFSAALTFTLSYVALWLLKHFAQGIVTIGMLTLSIAPFAIGLHLSGILHQVPLLGGLAPEPPTNYIVIWEGYFMLVWGVVIAVIGWIARKSIALAIDCMEMCSFCVFQTYMTLHPFLVLCIYVPLCTSLAYSLLLLISMGSIGTHDHFNPGPLFIRSALAFFICWWCWLVQIVYSFSEFALDYITATWCFQGGFLGHGRVDGKDTIDAFWRGARYHFGTFVLGGFLIGICRPVHVTLGNFISFVKLKGNPLGWLLRSCCMTGVAAYDQHIAPLSKAAFADVALKSNPYCKAARRAHGHVVDQADAARILSGATILIQWCSSAFFGFIGGLVGFAEQYEHEHATHFEDLVVISASAIVAICVHLPFTLLFDTVSDAILYCIEVEVQWEAKQQVPEIPDNSYSTMIMRHLPCVSCMHRGVNNVLYTSGFRSVSGFGQGSSRREQA